jgi:hypothetical protein
MVGRIGAIKNDMHNKEHGDKVGFYGFFESIDDQSVANALFDTAAGWLRTRGCDTMRGPMSPSVNDECGLLIKNNGTPPSLMMPYNFPYYEALHERYGLAKAKDLLAYDGGYAEAAPDRFRRIGERALKRAGITLRTLDKTHFNDEVELIKRLYNRAWEKNWGFVPLTDAEIDHLAKQLKPIVVPELVIFAERAGDETARHEDLREIDAMLVAGGIEQVHQILGSEVAGRARRVRTAACPARRCVERSDPGVEPRGDVCERGAAGVVEVVSLPIEGDAVVLGELDQLAHLVRDADADRVAEADLVDPELQEVAGDLDDARRVDGAGVGTAEGCRDVGAPPPAELARPGEDGGKRRE